MNALNMGALGLLSALVQLPLQTGGLPSPGWFVAALSAEGRAAQETFSLWLVEKIDLKSVLSPC